MEAFVNTVKSSAIGVAEYFTPVLKQSKFKETGVLTPSEFVIAGDHLVHLCPTWHWESGDEQRTKSYLPPDKQFLITRNVPCYKRWKDMEYLQEQEKEILNEDADGWIDTHHYAIDEITAIDQNIQEMSLGDDRKGLSTAQASHFDSDDDSNEDESVPLDMDEFVDNELNDLTDPNSFKPIEEGKSETEVKSCGENVYKTRTYDLNITYDKYYQVPRMWLCGYDERRKLLSVEKMYEDFSEDHARKTLTIESHPHILGPPMASVHPCRHAVVIKRLAETLEENGKELQVHQYLLLFLKLMQAVIPTIEYDYTRNITF